MLSLVVIATRAGGRLIADRSPEFAPRDQSRGAAFRDGTGVAYDRVGSVPLTIIAFFAGMIVLGLVVIVVETWWVVALVGITHMLASIVLGWLVWKQLDDDPDPAPEP